MYLIKTKGTADICDYLQIRDVDLSLIAHVSIVNGANEIKQILGAHGIDPVCFRLVEEIPYGIITKIV